MKKRIIKCIIPIAIMFAGILWLLLSREVYPEHTEEEFVLAMQSEEKRQEIVDDITVDSTSTETTAVFVMVHVCGSVFEPGVYRLENGARVVDAIEAAGGVKEEAVPDYLNLARLICDGDRIYVPSITEEGTILYETESYYISESSIKINLNTATKEELMNLPGIGEHKAESIIEYRKQNGNFKKIEDIMQINGIKEAVFNNIKDYVSV